MGEQRLRGNKNVQIQEVANSWVQIVYDSRPRVLPLESAELPISSERPSPARLISARAGVFGYVGRAELLDELEAWIDSPAPFAAYLVTGRGGAGKTRLAVELCLRLREWDWLCGFLARGDGEGRLDALIEAPTARLVVIDYAENRAEQLERLLPQLSASASAEEPVRVLLLVRTGTEEAGDASRRLGTRVQSVERVIEGSEVRVLGETNERLSLQEREQLFADAAAAVAGYAASPSPDPEPPDLDQEVFENPLMVVVAAYLAAHGERAPETRGELLDGVLEHERGYWRESASGEGASGLDADDPLLERAVAVATLLRAETEEQGAEHLLLHPDLSDAPVERRNRFARWVRDQYPGPYWWNPLEPDLVGEHLVTHCFADRPAVLRGALSAEEPESLIRPLETLGRAAADHPELAEALRPILSEELERLCGIAVAQARDAKDRDLLYGNVVTVAAALNALIAAVDVDGEALIAAADLMPPRADLVLSDLAATLAARTVDHLRPLADADSGARAPELAHALDHLSTRLSATGRHDEALAASKEAVAILRPLAEIDPAVAPGLARALGNLSNDLAATGRSVEAVSASEEAVAACHSLAEADPAAHAPNLASALAILSSHLAATGRPAEALALNEDSVAMTRWLAEADPAAHAPNLALALNNLSNRLGEAGRHDDALAASEEAVAAYRPLADESPGAFASLLASSLNNHANCLAATRRHDDALAASEEAVDTYRSLAEANPAAFAPNLANALNNLSKNLSEAGRHDAALARSEEAVDIFRTLAEASPAAFAPSLAVALSNHSLSLANAGRQDEALALSEEALSIRRPLAKDNPAVHAYDLALTLNALSRHLVEAGRHDEALAAGEEAVDTYRALAEDNWAAFAPPLAKALGALSVHLSVNGRLAEALEASEEAVDIYRPLAEANSAFAPELAIFLANLSVRLARDGRQSEALALSEEAVATCRPLVEAYPAAFAPRLAFALRAHADNLRESGREDDAEAAEQEAVELLEQLQG